MRATPLLVNAGANVTGSPFIPDQPGPEKWTFHAEGSYTATVQVQGTVDPGMSVFVELGDLSNGGIVTFDGPLVAVRAVVSGYVSGQVSVFVAAA